VEKYGRARQTAYGCTVHALCILGTKATDTCSEYAIFITFPQQQWLTNVPQVTFIHMLPLLLFLPLTYKISALNDVLCLQASFTSCLHSLKFLKARQIFSSSSCAILFTQMFVLFWMPHW
jgi:hypothetical protein